ncbi:MAG: acyl-CoA dehydrogenase family protein [Chloroflexi bacterium]|nr:acyl-CoA dehydrogenase family protein [Chloroflexota bacterium]
MRFEFTPEETAFRQEVKDFLKKDWKEDLNVVAGSEEWWAIEMGMRKKIAEKGWLALSWPKEYGGNDATVMQQVIFTDEWSYAHAPGRDGEGIGYIGPAIMVHGTEEQKKQHIGGIARGEVVWCQGYSEPEAGSDLASLSTRAVLEGDEWVINGQKIWTSQAHFADWILLLARTDPDAPKHRGITMLLVDMKTPGVSVRPIIDMTNGHVFNEVFFDNVRVPEGNVVGEVNRGWYAGMTLLDFERSGVEYAAVSRRALDETVKFASETRVNGKSLIQVPTVRNKLAEMAVNVEVSYMLSYQIAWLQSKGEVPNKEASMGKMFGTEIEQRTFQTAMQILGLYGQMIPGSKGAPLHGFIENNYLKSIADTIQSGTSEIQRRIVATRGLGLPRE